MPYGTTVHNDTEIEAVIRVLRSSTQMGHHVREMERRVAELFAHRHGVMVNSGSSALELAAELLALPSGAEVITSVLTFATTVSCLVRQGYVPAFVDVTAASYLIDVDKIEQMITPRTRAVSIPNLIGNIAQWDRIAALCEQHHLLLIEDSADTLGGTLQNQPSGSWSDISITSFYGNHVINCAGNGGMLCVQREEWAARARLLRSWGRASSLFVESEAIENRFNVELDGIPYDPKFVFESIGHNYEPSDVGAAFGLVQLDQLQHNIDVRNVWFERQRAFFAEWEHWFILPQQTPQTRTGWLAFPLTLREDAPFSRRDLQIALERRGVQTRVVFTGNILRQPGFRDITCVKAARGYPQADAVTRGGVLLACHYGLTAEMIARVHECFCEFAAKH